MNRIAHYIILLLVMLILSSCVTPGGDASVSNYTLKAPLDRALTKQETDKSLPPSVPEDLKPKDGLAKGSALSVTNAKLKQPSNPNESGSIVIDEGLVMVETGNTHHDSPSDKSLGKMRYFGGAVLVIGIILIGLKCKFPIIPIHLGIAVVVGGLVLAILPEIIEVTKTIIYIAFGVGILVCAVYLILSYLRHNRSESTLSIMVDSIRNLEDSDDPDKKRAATEIKNIFSTRMDVLNKNEIDRVKTKIRVR